METFIGIMIPFLGTTLGSACVFFMKKSLGDLVQRSLAGFAAGVMVAASIWSPVSYTHLEVTATLCFYEDKVIVHNHQEDSEGDLRYCLLYTS